MLLSIIICTFRRHDRVDLALASLVRQKRQSAVFEVLVVENDTSATSPTASVCANYEGKLPIRHILEPRIGLSYARNAGLKQARGRFLAYLDDDAEATDGWLSALASLCETQNPDFCGGPSLPLYRSPKPQWYLDKYATAYVYGSEPRWLKQGEWLGGMNFIVEKTICMDMGGFNVHLGMTGSTVAYGEETDLMLRAWEAKPRLKVFYHPEASVRHEVRPEKMTLKWLVSAAWAGGRSSVVMQPLARGAAIFEFLISAKELLSRSRRLKECFGTGGLKWHQFAFEEICPWLWRLSRRYHGFLKGK